MWASEAMDVWKSCMGVVCAFAWLLSLGVGASLAATFYVETFDADDAGWQDRDVGKMSVFYEPSFGLGPGSLGGSFAAQGVLFPEIDAFRIAGPSSGGAFVGDYLADVPSYKGWSFSFYAEDVLPSLLMISFDADGTVFNRIVTPQVGSVGQWYTIDVPLSYDGQWFGGSGLAFSNGFANVGYIDIQVSRSGDSAQTYYVDNFEFSELDAVPEPTSVALFGIAFAAVYMARRRKLEFGEKAG